MSPEAFPTYDSMGRLVSVDYIGAQEVSVTVFKMDVPGDMLPADEPAEQDTAAPDDPPRESK